MSGDIKINGVSLPEGRLSRVEELARCGIYNPEECLEGVSNVEIAAALCIKYKDDELVQELLTRLAPSLEEDAREQITMSGNDLYQAALDLRYSASCWEPDACLLGNVRAYQIEQICIDYAVFKHQENLRDED